MPQPLTLASASPRRREMLAQLGFALRIRPAETDETVHAGEGARDYVRRVAREKARAVEGDFVLGADTAVILAGRVLGKPDGPAEAARMLRELSGTAHEVLTGVCTWDFRVWGEVEQDRRWTWDEFNRLPRSRIQMDIHCVTRWSKFGTVWEGVSVKSLVDAGLIRIKPTATHVMQHAEYGFTVNVPLQVVMQDNFLMATHLDGEPITPDHGYTLRGVVGFIPGREDLITPYFWKGAKWLGALEFMPQDRRGFWEQAGYHNRADVWKEERFSYG